MLDTGKHCDLLPAASKWGWHLSCFSKLIAEDYLCFVKRPDDWWSWKCLLFLPADAFRLATGLFCGLCCWVCCELTDFDKDLKFGDKHTFDCKCCSDCEPQRPQQPVPAAVVAPPEPAVAAVATVVAVTDETPEIKMVEENKCIKCSASLEKGVRAMLSIHAHQQ